MRESGEGIKSDRFGLLGGGEEHRVTPDSQSSLPHQPASTGAIAKVSVPTGSRPTLRRQLSNAATRGTW